jgi:hypothetical protein
MTRLTSAQRKSVLATARHLDNLLVEGLRILRESGSEALFPQYVRDAAPSEARRIEDSIRQFRSVLVQALDEFGIDRPTARTSALHAARVNLVYAEVALEDLSPARLRGYGKVTPEAAVALEGLVADLRALLRQMMEVLGEGADRPERAEETWRDPRSGK